jgi:hypothetical protein
MNSKVEPTALYRRWVHSHEEDTNSEMVFRPADFKFPPSRGRREFEIRSDGTVITKSLGPTDRPQKDQGIWILKKNLLYFFSHSDAEPKNILHIITVDKTRLVVKK